MLIKIKYSTSEGPHLLNISLAEIQNMITTGTLAVRQSTRTGHKDITFIGTKAELSALSQALQIAAENL
ncbi:hypothetical protein [uncultured Desulfobacter sp.]|uniref:hypothetical protein n=1 Tax=uncultured Desulfobacter sp. TaxID=240139 RepID=UPI002AAB4E2C|nr:hypothetical protein [uncultured Desulfobacter sp.]